MKIIAVLLRGMSVFILLYSLLMVMLLLGENYKGNDYIFFTIAVISSISSGSNSFVYRGFMMFIEWLCATLLLLSVFWVYSAIDIIKDKELSEDIFIELLIYLVDLNKMLAHFKSEAISAILLVAGLSLIYVARTVVERAAFINIVK